MGAWHIRGRAAGNRVLVDFSGIFGVDWHWKKVDEFCDALRGLAEHAARVRTINKGFGPGPTTIIESGSPAEDLVIALSPRITLRTHGPRILVLIDSRQGFECGPAEALQLWEQFKRAARLAEEHDKVEQIIYDQALLTRVGVNIGLTDHPAIQGAAGREAAWNRELRRALPGGVRSEEMVGTPTLVRGPAPTKH